MMSRLKQEFVLGYREGWEIFWSPFTGLWRSLVRDWREHVRQRR
jgi:hypothetical protein